MQILLTSERFAFVSARVVLVRNDMSAAVEAECRESAITDLKVDAAGTYHLWLFALELQDLSSARTFLLHALLRPWLVEMTQQHTLWRAKSDEELCEILMTGDRQ